jgi:hypothetical protein
MNSHLARGTRLAFACTALAITLGGSDQYARAQAPATPDAKKSDVRLKEMEQLVRSLKVVAIDDRGKETTATLSAEPLHRWTDPTRDFDGGALWVWRTSGRPVAVVGVELYAMWSLEFVSVSTGIVRSDDILIHWKTRKAGVEFQEIPDAPVPADTKAGRLRQMSELAKRFSPREYWINGNGQHYALRLLPHPIDRYSDPVSGVVDGGLFVCANGTNPESLLLIESRRRVDGPPKWSFAAAPFSRAEVSVKLGSHDVWTSPSKDTGKPPSPADPYYVIMVPRNFSERVPAPRKKGNQ